MKWGHINPSANNYILFLTFTITGYVSVSVFPCLAGIPIGIARIKVLFSKVIINSNISHDQLVLTKNVLKKFYNMKEKIKNPNNK